MNKDTIKVFEGFAGYGGASFGLSLLRIRAALSGIMWIIKMVGFLPNMPFCISEDLSKHMYNTFGL